MKTNKDHQVKLQPTGDTTLRHSFGMSLGIGLGQAGADWQWTIDDDFVVSKGKHECDCGKDRCDCT